MSMNWTEDLIEREVEKRFDALDARLMAGGLSQAEYDDLSRQIDEWSDRTYRAHVCKREGAL
jgi:hypothetical protein